MIIDIHEKFDVSPQWFEEQDKRTDNWEERLCQLLSAYRVNDLAGTEKVVAKIKAVEINEEFAMRAMK